MRHKYTKQDAAKGGRTTAQRFPKSVRQEWNRRGGLKHKPNLEGCKKAGRVSWANRMAQAKVAEATAKVRQGISGQTKLIVRQAQIPWKGVF